MAAAPALSTGWARLSPSPRLRQLPLERLTRDALVDAVGGEPPDVVFHLASAGVNPRERAPGALLEGSDLYGAAKAAAHDCGRAVARALAVPLVTLRLFGVYGPGEAPHRLIPHLAARLRARERVDLTPGTQLRDLAFVDDVVEALILGATTAGLEPGAAYNVCSGRPTSVREVCLEVARQLGAPESLLDFGGRPPRPDEPPWLVGDPRRFRAATGWHHRMHLSLGVAASLAPS
ncbi:NAD(P)-dependent oxidoreductase [Sorangium sp. So ce269]